MTNSHGTANTSSRSSPLPGPAGGLKHSNPALTAASGPGRAPSARVGLLPVPRPLAPLPAKSSPKVTASDAAHPPSSPKHREARPQPKAAQLPAAPPVAREQAPARVSPGGPAGTQRSAGMPSAVRGAGFSGRPPQKAPVGSDLPWYDFMRSHGIEPKRMPQERFCGNPSNYNAILSWVAIDYGFPAPDEERAATALWLAGDLIHTYMPPAAGFEDPGQGALPGL